MSRAPLAVPGTVAEVVHWLAAMHAVAPPAGVPLADAFRAELAKSAPATTDVGLAPAMAAASQLAPDKAAAVFTALPHDSRRHFLAALLELSQSTAAAAGAMTHNVAALRLALFRLLPAMRGCPDVAALDMEGAVAADYGNLDRLAQWVRPDSANPAVLAATRRHAQLAEEAARAQAAAEQLATRLRAVGADPAKPELDASVLTPAGRRYRGAAVALGLLLGLLLLAAGVWLWLSRRKAKDTCSLREAVAAPSVPAPAPRPAAAVAGPFAGGALPVAPMPMSHLMAPWSAVGKS